MIVFTANNMDSIMYSGNENYNNKLFLYYNTTINHYHGIRNVKGFLGTVYFCEECLKPYTTKVHRCKMKYKLFMISLIECIGVLIKCDKCNREFNGQESFNNHIINCKDRWKCDKFGITNNERYKN